MAVEASSDEAHVAHDPGQDPLIENELTEYIRATDPATEVIKGVGNSVVEGGFYFSLNKSEKRHSLVLKHQLPLYATSGTSR